MPKNIKPQRKSDNTYFFEDYPDFTPNLSPKEIFQMRSFGGTYWRPIYSQVTKKHYKNQHKKYPASWWEGLDEESELTRAWDDYDIKFNRYGKKVGTTLEFWENKGWIKPSHPYGWVQWYCDFFMGKRSKDDERQISRWKGLAGPNGRFRKWLVTEITKKKTDYDDIKASPAMRQTLQHWAYKLTKKDYDAEIEHRANKNKESVKKESDKRKKREKTKKSPKKSQTKSGKSKGKSRKRRSSSK